MMKRAMILLAGLSIFAVSCGSDSKKGGSKNPGTTNVDPITGRPYDPTLNPNGTSNPGYPNTGGTGNASQNVLGNWTSVAAPGSNNNSVSQIQFNNQGTFTFVKNDQYNSSASFNLQGTYSANQAGSFIAIDLSIGQNQNCNGYDRDPKGYYPPVNPNNPGQGYPYNPGYDYGNNKNHNNNGCSNGNNNSARTIQCIARLQTSQTTYSNTNTNNQTLLLRCEYNGGTRPQNFDGATEGFRRN